MANTASLLFPFLFLIASSTVSISAEDCVYTFYVKTGSVARAGTHSTISVRLSDANGDYVDFSNLETWGGAMGPNYNYFETGHLDIFSGRAACLSNPVCALNLTSDGSGPYHGWFCSYAKVITSGVNADCSQKLFNVEQWLATDTAPFELTAVRNYCPNVVKKEKSAADVM